MGHPSPARLEAFSDGVIAVIITIMVLDIKVPHESGIAGFFAVVPAILVYFLSFAMTGIYWINHHHLIHRLKHVDDFALYANLGFLSSFHSCRSLPTTWWRRETTPFRWRSTRHR